MATASSLLAPSAAAAAPAKTNVAARADISGCLKQMCTFYLRAMGWAGDRKTAHGKIVRKERTFR